MLSFPQLLVLSLPGKELIPLITLLAKWLCKPEGRSPAQLRTAYGVLCGAVGIALNLLLFAGKFFAGTLSGSIAITADAFNNLSDAGSSVVTLLGFRIAAKTPDPGHPFGHGRRNTSSGLAVAILILLMGAELGKESVAKVLHPEAGGILSADPRYSGRTPSPQSSNMAAYNRSVGNRRRFARALALLAAATDSLSDSAATAAVLLATLAGHFTALPLDGWVGILVALFILKGGLGRPPGHH